MMKNYNAWASLFLWQKYGEFFEQKIGITFLRPKFLITFLVYNGKSIEKDEMKLLLDDVHRYGTKFLQSAWFLLDINEKEVAALADKQKIDFQKLPSIDIYKPATQGLEEMVVRYNDQNYRKNLRTFQSSPKIFIT